MMRVARAGVGVDCGGGNATERKPWTQQQHILTQETEETVLFFFLFKLPAGHIRAQDGHSSSFSSITSAEARMMTCQRSGDVKTGEQDATRPTAPARNETREKHDRGIEEG